MANDARAGDWSALSTEVERGLRAWRQAHPRATLDEIVESVEGELGHAQGAPGSRFVEDLVAEGGEAEAEAWPVCAHCGGTLERRGQRVREVLIPRQATPLQVRRTDGVCRVPFGRCGSGLSPLDEELGLLPGSMSPRLLGRVVRRGSSERSFAQAAAEVADYWGIWLGEETVRRGPEGTPEAAGQADVAVQEAERPGGTRRLEHDLPEPPQGPPVQQVSVEGAMVPLWHREWAERPGGTRTLAIGTVTIALNRDGEQEVRTTDLSSFSRLADAETFVRQARGEVYRRGTQTAGTVAAVNDGSPWTQGVVDTYRRDAVRISGTRVRVFPHRR